jgi:putative flippase GtrA
MSYNWTFKSAASLPKSIALYLVLFAFNQLFSNFAIVWLIGLGLPALFAKVITMGCIVLWNFVLYRKVVFK